MDVLLEAARLVHYGAALQLFGVAAFAFVLAPPTLREGLTSAFRRIAVTSAALMLASGIVWLAATAGSMGDGWVDVTNIATMGKVLRATRFGQVWGPHLLLTLVLLGLSFVPGLVGWVLLTLGAGIALVTLGMVGHGAIASGFMGVLNVASQAIHLLSSGFWLGSLVPLFVLLRRFYDPAQEAEAAIALHRFSGLGHYAVAVLLLSGVSNSWFILQPGPIDLTVPYQQLLAVKIALALGMACLAVINRYVFVPRMPNRGPGIRQLGHGTVAEMVLGAAILVIVSVIGIMSPS